MKPPFFALFCRFPRVIFGVKAENIINGGGIFQVFRSDFEANELLYESVFQTYLGDFVCAQSNVTVEYMHIKHLVRFQAFAK